MCCGVRCCSVPISHRKRLDVAAAMVQQQAHFEVFFLRQVRTVLLCMRVCVCMCACYCEHKLDDSNPHFLGIRKAPAQYSRCSTAASVAAVKPFRLATPSGFVVDQHPEGEPCTYTCADVLISLAFIFCRPTSYMSYAICLRVQSIPGMSFTLFSFTSRS